MLARSHHYTMEIARTRWVGQVRGAVVKQDVICLQMLRNDGSKTELGWGW